MELVFFKVAFFVLMGIATVGLVAIVTMFGVVLLKALWPLLRMHPRVAKTGHI